jgi:hypothetical protein
MLLLVQPARGLDPDVFESMPLRLKIQLAKLSEEQRVRAVQWHSDEALTTASKSSAAATTSSTTNNINTRRSSTGTTPPKAALRHSSGSHSDASPQSVHGTSTSNSTAAASHYTAEGDHTADNHSRHNGEHFKHTECILQYTTNVKASCLPRVATARLCKLMII